MQITYTLKNNKMAEQGDFDPETKQLTMASGRELDLSREDDLKLAKKLIYAKVVTMPAMELVSLSRLVEK